jgi:predicted amidophosphoribosyltransferase
MIIEELKMPTLLDSMRQTRDKTALEADKMIRIRREQGAIDQLRRDIAATEVELSKAALAAYRAGELTHPTVVQICQQIDALETQISQREARIEQIRQEQIATPPPQPGRACSRCGTEVPAAAAFCPGCGAPAPKVAPIELCARCGVQLPTSASFCPTCGTPRALRPQPRRCAKCGAELPDAAAFCLECGTRVAVAVQQAPAVVAPQELAPAFIAPVATVPPARRCQNCGESLPEEAAFCLECGTRVSAAPSPEVVSEPPPSPVAAAVQPPPAEPEPPPTQSEDAAASTKAARATRKKTSAEIKTEPQPVEDEARIAPAPVVEAPAERRCPTCNAVLTDDAVFCSDCGARLS